MEASYSLKRLTSSNDESLLPAFKVYINSTNPAIRTDTNTIKYWIENYNSKYSDEFHALAFYMNGVVIGYTQITYFNEEKLTVIDYIAIDANYRSKHNVFFSFCDLIKGYIENNFPDCLFTLVEIIKIDNPVNRSDDFNIMSRLLGMVGFYQIEVPYYQLELSLNLHESFMEAAIFISPRPMSNSVKKSTVLSMLKTLYIKHYVRWYEIYSGEDFDNYKAKAEELYKSAAETIKEEVKFTTRHPDDLPDLAPSTAVEQEKKGTVWSVLMILFLLLLSGCTLVFIKREGILFSEFWAASIFVFMVFLILLGISIPNKNSIIKEHLIFLKNIFRKND